MALTTRIPGRFLLLVHGLCALGVLLFAGLAWVEQPPARWAAAAVLVAAVLLWVAAARATLPPWRPAPAPRGSVELVAPRLVAGSLVAAWMAMLVAVGAWAWIAVTDLDRIGNPGFALVMLLGALGSLPDLARLLTGRLHRWRLTAGPDGLDYRGYRTAVSLPWSQVDRVSVRERPRGVVISSGGEEYVVPWLAFDVPPEEVARLVQQARAARR